MASVSLNGCAVQAPEPWTQARTAAAAAAALLARAALQVSMSVVVRFMALSFLVI